MMAYKEMLGYGSYSKVFLDEDGLAVKTPVFPHELKAFRAIRPAWGGDSTNNSIRMQRLMKPAFIRNDSRFAAIVALDVVNDLSAIHAAGYVHCDVKPDNIMYGMGTYTLIDYGNAVLAGEMALYRSPVYAAPEHLLMRPVDWRADQYALGCSIIKMYAGRHAFAGGKLDMLIERKKRLELSARIDGAEGGAVILSEIVMRMIQPDPDARYQDEGELRAAIAGI
jgi:serine/threonine protein kinase